jgi:hypothetical protein
LSKVRECARAIALCLKHQGANLCPINPDSQRYGIGDSLRDGKPNTATAIAITKPSASSIVLATGQAPVVLTIVPPVVASAELHLYRARMDTPLHAIGAELRRGDQVVAKIEPIHAQGLSAAQVKGFLREVLLACSVQAGENLGKFDVQQERSPGMCPIQGCSLLC